MRLLVLTAVAGLAATSLAQSTPFYVYTMQVLDMRIPYTMHNISFNVNAPNSTKEEGGDDFGLCSIGWFTGSGPECWTKCKSDSSNSSASNPESTYYARLDSYSSADAFNITIFQGYPGSHKTGQISIRDGQDGYYCSHGAQTTQCSIGFPFKSIQVATIEEAGCEPSGDPVC